MTLALHIQLRSFLCAICQCEITENLDKLISPLKKLAQGTSLIRFAVMDSLSSLFVVCRLTVLQRLI